MSSSIPDIPSLVKNVLKKKEAKVILRLSAQLKYKNLGTFASFLLYCSLFFISAVAGFHLPNLQTPNGHWRAYSKSVIRVFSPNRYQQNVLNQDYRRLYKYELFGVY